MRNSISSIFGNTTPVVKNLLIINALFFLAYMVIGKNIDGQDLNEYLGLHYLGADNFRPIQFLTYMFLHANFPHFFFNMFALWMFGKTLESVWGPKRFLIYYFVTGIGAALIQLIAIKYEISPVLAHINNFINNPSPDAFVEFINSGHFKVVSYDIQNNFNNFIGTYNSLVNTNPTEATYKAVEFISQYKIDYLNAHQMVGASGAVFGILLAFGMLFPNTQLFIIPFPFPIKAKWLVIGYGAFELYSAWDNQPGDNVAHLAHLGGMIFGFVLIKMWTKKRNTFY